MVNRVELIRDFTQLQPRHRGCVATLGNFDGVHRGHQVVFRQLLDKAGELGLPATAIIFEPQPQEFFLPERAPSRLTRLREKLLIFSRLGVDRVLCLYFNRRLADMSPGEFIERILVNGLGIRHLIVGDDFRFGRGRQGDFAELARAGGQHGFSVADMETFYLDGERVSSTRVRQALALGDMDGAARLLARPYSLCGRVAHGDKRGRLLGFPTANVHLHRRFSPIGGVFAVRVHGVADTPVRGVANLGIRPTVRGTPRPLLEVHLFDFSAEVYGRHVEVEFLARLREEQRFSSFEALKEQIGRDIQAARNFLVPHGR